MLAQEQRRSVEDAAHVARQSFFERVASRLGADRIAVGHTRDDQAETFLLRLLRGAGPRGLAGIHPRNGVIVRPLLDVSRLELQAFLRAEVIPFREDDTNRDVDIPRNRIRHELLPYLARAFSPGIMDVLAREATIAREDADWLEAAANTAAERIVSTRDGSVCIDLTALRREPAALAWRVARQALTLAAPGRFFGFDHVQELLHVAADDGPGGVTLPGQQATRRGGQLILTPCVHGASAVDHGPTAFCYSLSIPGEVPVAEAALVVSAERVSPADLPDRSSLSSRASWVAVEAADLGGPLMVRSRRAGDEFRPLGLAGRKKLQDLFVDRKIARQDRDRVPIVVDSGGRIVWIVGQAVAEDFRITARTRSVILLKARQLGGAG